MRGGGEFESAQVVVGNIGSNSPFAEIESARLLTINNKSTGLFLCIAAGEISARWPNVFKVIGLCVLHIGGETITIVPFTAVHIWYVQCARGATVLATRIGSKRHPPSR